MSVRVMSWVMHDSPSTGNDRLVLLVIADEADDDGRNAFPGIDRIALKARVSRSTAIRSIERLEEAGELLVKRPEVHGRGRHNRYVVLMGRAPDVVAGEVGWAPPRIGVTLPPIREDEKGVTEAPNRCQNPPEKVSPVTPDPSTHNSTRARRSSEPALEAANIHAAIAAARARGDLCEACNGEGWLHLDPAPTGTLGLEQCATCAGYGVTMVA